MFLFKLLWFHLNWNFSFQLHFFLKKIFNFKCYFQMQNRSVFSICHIFGPSVHLRFIQTKPCVHTIGNLQHSFSATFLVRLCGVTVWRLGRPIVRTLFQSLHPAPVRSGFAGGHMSNYGLISHEITCNYYSWWKNVVQCDWFYNTYHLPGNVK